MFDFWSFYKGLLERSDYFDNYWDRFPEGRLLRFKKETIGLLKNSINNKNSHELSNILAIIYNDGADNDFTQILLSLLDENWHTSEENIISILEVIKDPNSVEKLYSTAIEVPEYDDMRAIAKKCMWALSAINTLEAREKLKLLSRSNDLIIKENAIFQLEQLIN